MTSEIPYLSVKVSQAQQAMNLAYILYSLDSAESGVSKKIANQVGTWVEQGHKVTVIRAGPSVNREGYEKANRTVGANLIYRATDGTIGRWGRWLGLKKPLDYEGTRRLLTKWRPYAGFIYFHLLLDGLANAGVLIPRR